ncbi:hypothetical protein N9X12_06755 [Alphaproteobacteria bacterium]|nr:hypothetical protein [Alphaproteobacteria bacterium]
MHFPRLFTLPLVPLSFIKLLVVTGLLAGCQPQNVTTTNTTKVTSTKAISDPAPLSTPVTNAIAEPVIVAPSDATMNTDMPTTDNATSIIVASAPLQPDVSEPQVIAPEIVIPAPAPPPAEFKPQNVLSKPDTVLLSLLGTADIIRTEGQVKIWQYRLDRCVFDFFLTSENGIYAVRDWAYRATMLGVTANELICRRALAKDRMKPASG